MFKKALLICASVLSVQAASSSSIQQDHLFKGRESIDFSALEQVRHYMTAKRWQKVDVAFPSEEVRQLYNQTTQNVFRDLGIAPDPTLSILDIFLLPFRELIKTHTPNPEEQMLFDATPLKEFYRELVKYGTAQSETGIGSLYLISRTKPFMQDQYTGNIGTQRAVKNVIKALDAQHPFSFVPVMNQSELGFALLTKCFLDGIFPMSCSKEGGRAHGVNFSGFGFLVHDFAHALLQHTRQQEINHLESILKAYTQKGYVGSDVMKAYTSTFLAKYNLQKQVYINLLQHIVDTNDIKSLIAFFLTVHEFALVKNYESNDLKTVFKCAIDAINQTLETRVSKEIDMEKATDAKIIRHILGEQYKSSTPEEQTTAIQRDSLAIYEYKINRNHRYIHVESIEKRDGTAIIGKHNAQFYPTKQQLVWNSEDFEKVLRIAGISVNTDKSNIDLYVTSINDGLKELMSHFSTVATAFAESNGTAYKSSFDELTAQFEEELTNYSIFPTEQTVSVEFNPLCILQEQQELLATFRDSAAQSMEQVQSLRSDLIKSRENESRAFELLKKMHNDLIEETQSQEALLQDLAAINTLKRQLASLQSESRIDKDTIDTLKSRIDELQKRDIIKSYTPSGI